MKRKIRKTFKNTPQEIEKLGRQLIEMANRDGSVKATVQFVPGSEVKLVAVLEKQEAIDERSVTAL